MRNKTFYDLAQAQRYLNSSIIRVADEPVWVEETLKKGADIMLYFSKLDEVGLNPKSIKSTDPDVDMNPVPLGMVNTFIRDQPAAYYCSRSPVRKQRIGLARDNLDVRTVNGRDMADMRNYILPSSALSLTIRNRYPTIARAWGQVKRTGGTAAISRRLAIDGNARVWYMGYPDYVGMLYGNNITLMDQFIYLQDVVNEELNARN